MDAVNMDLIRKRLSEIRDAARLLEKYLQKPFRELDLSEILSVRYLIIQLVESSTAICMHVLITVYREYPEGYPSCFILMSRKGLISNELGEKLAAAARLRNLLIHRYWEIDDRKVYNEAKKGLRDFIEFTDLIERWLKDGDKVSLSRS